MHWTINLEGGPRRVNHAAVTIRDKVFSFGGYCSGEIPDHRDCVDIHVLDTRTYRWMKVFHKNEPAPETTEVVVDNDRRPVPNSPVPYQRYGHTVCAYNDKAYLWGGRNDDFGASNTLHEFDPQICKWQKIEVAGTAPPARDGHTAVIVGHRMFVFGGFEEELQRFSQETYVFDFTLARWSEFGTMIYQDSPPMWRDFHTAVAIDEKMYVFGGRSDQNGQVGDGFHSTRDLYDDTLMVLDLATGYWSTPTVCGDRPGGRRSHSSWSYKGKLYIFGGYLGTENVHYNELYSYDPDTSRWILHNVPGLGPMARRRQCTVLVGNQLFLFGGTMPSSSPCTSPNNSINSTISLGSSYQSGLSDLADLYVLDYAPSLRQLSLISFVNSQYYENCKNDKFAMSMLPIDIQYDIMNMTVPNAVTTNQQQRNEAFG